MNSPTDETNMQLRYNWLTSWRRLSCARHAFVLIGRAPDNQDHHGEEEHDHRILFRGGNDGPRTGDTEPRVGTMRTVRAKWRPQTADMEPQGDQWVGSKDYRPPTTTPTSRSYVVRASFADVEAYLAQFTEAVNGTFDYCWSSQNSNSFAHQAIENLLEEFPCFSVTNCGCAGTQLRGRPSPPGVAWAPGHKRELILPS